MKGKHGMSKVKEFKTGKTSIEQFKYVIRCNDQPHGDYRRVEIAGNNLNDVKNEAKRRKYYSCTIYKRSLDYETGEYDAWNAYPYTPIYPKEEKTTKMKNCTIKGNFLQPCTALDGMLDDTKGLRYLTFYDLDTCEPTRSCIVSYTGEHRKKGIILNYCPMCGERIIDQMLENKNNENS